MIILRRALVTVTVTMIVTVFMLSTCYAEDKDSGRTSLVAGFRDPPAAARPSSYYLLLNGYVNREHMDWELGELYAKGVRGLCVFEKPGE